MFDPVYLVTIFAPFLFYYLYMKWTYKGPPHITGLPIVGYLPFLGKYPHLKLQELAKKHGPIFSLYMGSYYAVVLNNYDVIQEAYVDKGNVFNDRPSYLIFKVYDYETGFAGTGGEEWKATRNFSMNTLKHLGFGKNYTKNFVQMEIQDFIRELKNYEGRPVNVKESLGMSTNILIISLMTGKRYDRSDDTGWMAEVSKTAAALMRSHTLKIWGLISWMTKIPILRSVTIKYNSRTLKDRLWSLIDEEIASQKATYNPDAQADNFFHSWFIEQEKRNKSNDPYKYLFSDFGLKNNVDHLIEASSESTSTTLLWAFVYLIIYTDVQKNLHQEIDERIGHTREPELEDVKNMHYVRAFLLELHRVATLVPIGPFHSNKVNGTIAGYEIPKDAFVIPHFWAIHHDPKYFPDPYKFDPERFLDGERKFKSSEYLGPFSFGRRICPGKTVAEMQLFLYLTSILQVFELKAPPGSRPDETKDIFDKNLLRRPAPQDIIFQVRNTTTTQN